MLIQETLYEKIQATRETIREFIRFFEEIISWYDVMNKHMKKADLDKRSKQLCEYEPVHFAISKVQQLNMQENE